MSKMLMTPAALAALLAGDKENFIAASTPGGIEKQERAGQIRESFTETIPKEFKDCKRKDFEKLGFKFLRETDKIFWQCEFPKGWRKKPTEHEMWSELLDDKGHVRAMIFFKAAFYDYSAHIYLVRRFKVDAGYGRENVRQATVIDTATGETLFSTEVIQAPDWNDRTKAALVQAKIDEQYKLAEDWLIEKYPAWKSHSEYWE